MIKTELSTVRTFSPNNDLVEERRRQIIEAALHLIATKGIQKTNIREIAAASKMTIGNLYHYVGKREDIIFLAFDYGIDQARRLVDEIEHLCANEGPRESLRLAIDRYIRYHGANWQTTTFIYKEMVNLAPNFRQPIIQMNARLHDMFIKMIEGGCRTGDFRCEDAFLVASNIVSMGDMWALKRWHFKKNYDLDKYIRSFTMMTLNLIGA